MRTFSIHNQTPLKTMQKATHTPGPWKIKPSNSSPLNIVCAKNEPVADTSRHRLPLEAMLNARLIAAAPELLLALEQAVARVELANAEGNPILSAWLPEARQAIAKAKEKNNEN